MRTRLLPLLLLPLLACAPEQEPQGEGFGAAVTTSEQAIPADDLLASYTPAQLEDTVQVTLTGTVHEVCQAKGCWMTVAAGPAETMMVKFKDYAFFVPKDISGRDVTMQGKAFYEVVPVDELRHLAQDGGASAEAVAEITEPRRELRFLADGVLLK